MSSAHVSRQNSLASGLLGSVLLGLGLLVASGTAASERDDTPREAVFANQTVPALPRRMAATTAEPETRPAAVRPKAAPTAMPDLDAGELFPAESFAEATALPGCTTVASLAERLLGTCLRQGLSSSEKALTQRLLDSAAQRGRTDAWSRDTESLFRLAQCAGSPADERLVVGAALAAADAELQGATARTLSECRRDHAQRAQWLWSYRLSVLDVAEGQYLRAAAALFRLHRTAPSRSLLAVINDARQHVSELHGGEPR